MRYLFFLLFLTVTSCAQQVYDFHSIPIGVVNGKRLYVGKKFDKNLFRITSLF